MSCYSQDHEPYHPSTYREDADIPFAPDGNAPLISAYIERVKGIFDFFRGLKCVRKTINISPSATAELQATLKRELVREAKILYMARHYHVVRLIHTYFDQTDEGKERYAVIMDRAEANLQTYLGPGRTPALPWTREYCAPEVDSGSTRGRSADNFSLGAVYLEMLVALNDLKYSKELSGVLKGMPESTASYSEHVDDVRKWIEESFHPPGWQGDFLVICRMMLRRDRDTRPSAADIQNAWVSIPLPDTSMVCTCTGNLAPTKIERLIEACKGGSERDVRSLLEQGAEPGTSEAIHYASVRGSPLIVQALLDAGVHVDTRNSVRQTALQCAARNGSAEVVHQLLENHADVNARDENGQTALHGAAAQGHESIFIMLLDAQADLLAEDVDGQTALHFAARRHYTIVEALLESRYEQSSQR